MKNIFLFSILCLCSTSLYAEIAGENVPVPTELKAGRHPTNIDTMPQLGPIGAIAATEDISNSVLISPNPAANYLDVKFTRSNESKIEMGLYDITGKLLKSLTETIAGEKTIRITRDNFPTGVYFLSIKTEDGQECRKVIFS